MSTKYTLYTIREQRFSLARDQHHNGHNEGATIRDRKHDQQKKKIAQGGSKYDHSRAPGRRSSYYDAAKPSSPLPPWSRHAQHRAETAHQFAPSSARFAAAKHAGACLISNRISVAPRAAEKAAREHPLLVVENVMASSSSWCCEPVALAADQ